MRRLAWCTVGLLAVAASGGAQRTAPASLGQANAGIADSGRKAAPWYAPLASLAVPGLGQTLLHQNRGLGYFAVELYSFLGYRTETIEADRGRDRYRSLARDVARAFFGPNRPDGPWAYYEAMEKFDASGAFDRIPGGDVDPEVDVTTFNGSIWKLARDTFWPDPNVTPPLNSPAYINAVNMYSQRAVQPAFQWSWQNAALEHDLYKRSISLSNDSFRRAREQLGILVANHLLSMADAFATIRVRSPVLAQNSQFSVEISVPWPNRR
jgi:hypothetical protein